MLKVKTVLRFGEILLGALLVASLAGPALAGSVYSWRSEDGSFAFTDDPKRIPAKHKAEAKKRYVGKLSRYERYTKLTADVDKPYTERLREQQSAMRQAKMATPPGVVIGSTATTQADVFYGLPASGGRGRAGAGASYIVPLDGDRTMSDNRPTTIESIRVKPVNSMATRHWTVVKKGDRIVSVIKGELRQRPLKSKSESDFDL